MLGIFFCIYCVVLYTFQILAPHVYCDYCIGLVWCAAVSASPLSLAYLLCVMYLHVMYYYY